ncbi:MAG: hypothetical protein HWE22_11215 [Flavobacteriales bacterium]|nr:hypothetical protein [Flavobacteriales bacterium]
MKFKLFSIFALAIFATSSCSDPDAWDDEKKQVLIDKCDTEIYDCDCYVKTTVEAFPKAQDYNKTLENESANADAVEAYYQKLDGCMTE